MNVSILVVPYDSGRYRERMGRGPERLLESGIKPLLAGMGHPLVCEEITFPDSHPAEIKTAFSLCRQVSDRVRTSLDSLRLPIVLSGNCNIAVGAVAGCGCENTGVVWFDAHGESTTPETTSSGFLDGMGLSILTGQCWRRLADSIPHLQALPGRRVLLVGSRDVEPDELALIEKIGIRRARKIADFTSTLEALLPEVDGVYLHLDLDVLDPTTAVANHWPTPGGLTLEDLKQAVGIIQTRTKIKGLGIASYDPEVDRDGRALHAACSIVESLLNGMN